MCARIAFYCVATELGGAERSLLELVRGLGPASANRLEPWVILPKATGPLREELQREDIPHSVLEMPETVLRLTRQNGLLRPFRLARSVPEAVFYFGRLLSHLRHEVNPVAIHTTGLKCHALGAAAGRAAGRPVFWHLLTKIGTDFTGCRPEVLF